MDTHIATGSRVPPFYDSLMAKIIAHGPDRAAAHRSPAQGRLAATRVNGVIDEPFFPRARARRSGISARRRRYRLSCSGCSIAAESVAEVARHG